MRTSATFMRIGAALPRVARFAAPIAAAVVAFQASARVHVVDVLITGAVCGNPANGEALVLLGHCAACWTSAGLAGSATGLTMAAIASLRGAAVRPT